MKRHTLLVIWAIILIATQIFVNCSNPLETTDGDPINPNPNPGVDTLLHIDTVVVIDSIGGIDTIFVVDTVNITDTVKIIDPDSDESQIVCSRIAMNQQEIIWMFRNPEGQYKLEFSALPESANPAQVLTVDIDGQEFQWTPSKDLEFIESVFLSENAMIMIYPKKPPALGHSIYICLTITGQ